MRDGHIVGELMRAFEAEQELLCPDTMGLALVLVPVPLWRGRQLGRFCGMGAVRLFGQTQAGRGRPDVVVARPPSWGRVTRRILHASGTGPFCWVASQCQTMSKKKVT